MIDKILKIKKKYDEITAELENSEDLDVAQITKLSKEQSKLYPAFDLWQRYEKNENEIKALQEIVDDVELGDDVKQELAILYQNKEMIEQEMQKFLMPKDINDSRNVIMEIRGAAGGDEANIFAGDLYRMYLKYAEQQGWQVELLNSEEGTAGGFTLVQFLIKGTNVYERLKYENGAHRVQRVPVTETQGRVHTSTATVLVMPEAEDSDVEINMGDLKIDVFRSSGAGGQSVNTTDSAVRITHQPTGIVVSCQNERSQIRNKEKAMQMLKTKIYEKTEKERQEKEGNERKNKIGTGDRSEKIRTYNYPQNRVTDHRLNLSVKKLDQIMEGHLKEIIDNLIMHYEKVQMQGANEGN